MSDLLPENCITLVKIDKIPENEYLITRSRASKKIEGISFLYSTLVTDRDVISGHARLFPTFVYPSNSGSKKVSTEQISFLDQVDEPDAIANLSKKARTYLSLLSINNPDSNFEEAVLIWRHALAIGYSPAYLEEHEDGIKDDFPRIPLPATADLLHSSASTGKQVAELLNTEKSVSGVTVGNIRDELRLIGIQTGKDLEIRVRWGYIQQETRVMPGPGDARERDYSNDEREAIEEGASALNMDFDTVLSLLGDKTYDLYLNETTYWKNIPANVYDYHIGGYQVIKKWLSYRNSDVIGRELKGNEVTEVTNMARRIAAIILLQPTLNTNYQNVKANLYDWPKE